MPIRLQIIYFSLHGHVAKLARAIADGAHLIESVQANRYRIPDFGETVDVDAEDGSEDVGIATPDTMRDADAIIFGTPTRYGNAASQLTQFLDQSHDLWESGELEGTVGSAFTSTASQHAGQETTLMNFQATLMSLGMVVVGVPPSEERLRTTDEISGGSPFGASTISGHDGRREPTENEYEIARTQGQRVAKTARALSIGHDNLP